MLNLPFAKSQRPPSSPTELWESRCRTPYTLSLPLNLFLSLCPSNAILLSLPSYFFNLEPTQHSWFFFLLLLSPVIKSLKNLFRIYINSTPSSLSGCRPKRWTLPELSFCCTAIALRQPLIQSTMSRAHRGSGVWLCLTHLSSSNGSSLLVMGASDRYSEFTLA